MNRNIDLSVWIKNDVINIKRIAQNKNLNVQSTHPRLYPINFAEDLFRCVNSRDIKRTQLNTLGASPVTALLDPLWPVASSS